MEDRDSHLQDALDLLWDKDTEKDTTPNVSAIALECKASKSTLKRLYSKGVTSVPRKGRRTTLSEDEEKIIAGHVFEAQNKGDLCRRK